MKKTILTLAILFSISFSSTVLAQGAKCNVMKMSKELKISKEQKETIKSMNADFQKQKEAIKRTRITEEMQKMKIEALRKEHKAKVMAILTPEQQTEFESKMLKTKGKRGKMNKTNKAGQVWALAGIELSEEQKKQYKELGESYTKQRAELDKKQKEDVRSLLTPEQQAIYDTNTTRNKTKSCCASKAVIACDKLDATSKAKIDELKAAHKAQVEAVKNSRIAPEMQETKIKILNENLEKAIKEIADKATK